MDRNDKTTDIRSAASQMLKTEDASDQRLQTAKDNLREMIEDAEKHGFSAAEVIKAVLAPVFAPRPKGCDCFSCITRREGEGAIDAHSDDRVEIATE